MDRKFRKGRSMTLLTRLALMMSIVFLLSACGSAGGGSGGFEEGDPSAAESDSEGAMDDDSGDGTSL